ncbi:YicC/YloC family endoribonuclease [Hydrogenoanaerobacterium sp.]|uniref:YicC/YloC family endoribonuclease n=1 Tax=Hydrogenoanaerobacterium sp. TaxID=2953763 RepID=UPI00289F10A0|nr:YicC/YloC family endoribonuclease [Hydrogenoanaerobacterium sp.]
MIRSMTGFGRAQETIDGRDILVEIKSVNHRFFEFSCRVPRAYGYLEEKLKSYLQTKISRGKVDVNVTVVTLEGANAQVEVNYELAKSYTEALRALGDKLGLVDDLSLSAVSRFSDIFTVRKGMEDEEVIWNGVKTVLDEAAERFVAMRAAEGDRLKEDCLNRLVNIENAVGLIENRSPRVVEEYRARLYNKLKDVLENTNIDDQRILTEAAIFSEKTAVDEETVRLRSHIAQFRDILKLKEPVGRKLDFLVQEFNRETNTIGSKAQDIEVARIVVDVKSEIEKIREQIQNIE